MRDEMLSLRVLPDLDLLFPAATVMADTKTASKQLATTRVQLDQHCLPIPTPASIEADAAAPAAAAAAAAATTATTTT